MEPAIEVISHLCNQLPLQEWDELNEETFGSAEAGDWECEHDKFVHTHDANAPAADELPRFWEASNDVSFLWEPQSLDNLTEILENERGVNVEETLQKLVSEEDTFEDPAILDISKKVSHQKLYGSAFDDILGAPAYPSVPTSILGGQKDIWSINEGAYALGQNSRNNVHPTSNSLNMFEFLQQVRNGVPNAKDASTESQLNIFKKLLDQAKQSEKIRESASYKQEASFDVTNAPMSSDLSVQPNFIKHAGTASTQAPNLMQLFPGGISESLAMPAAMPSVARGPAMFLPQQQFQNGPRPSNLGYSQAKPTAVPFNLKDPTAIPDLRFFQCIPPPGHPGLRARLPPGPPPPPPIGFIPPTSGPPTTGTGVGMFGYNQRLPNTAHMPIFLPHATPNWNVMSSANASTTTAPIPTMTRTMATAADTNRFHVMHHQTNTSTGTVEQAPFDPNVGSWMTQSESMSVLWMYLRPLMVSNPYIQDYFFAVHWLRRMNASRAKQLSTSLPYPTRPLPPPPVMHMPSPVTLDLLSDPTHHHCLSMTHSLVMSLTTHRTHSPLPLSTLDSVPDNDGRTTPVNQPNPTAPPPPPLSPSHSIASTDTSSPFSSALGRRTKSNVYRQRMVAELSLASALTEESGETTTTRCDREGVDKNASASSPLAIKAARRLRLLLARIERMYTSLLNIDEVDVSLARVVVQNETRTRLIQHRQELLQHLLKEWLHGDDVTRQSTESAPALEDPLRWKRSVNFDFFSVRKGVRLFSTMLHYLPSCTSLLYSGLRHTVYQMTNIDSFMITCFPRVCDTSDGVDNEDEVQRVQALVQSELGLSLILCLLDVCARLSKPNDPSNFVQCVVYFIHATNRHLTEKGVQLRPVEPFPHLASIIPVYVRPNESQAPDLSAEQIEQFCHMIHPPPPVNEPAVLPPAFVNGNDGETKTENSDGVISTTVEAVDAKLSPSKPDSPTHSSINSPTPVLAS